MVGNSYSQYHKARNKYYQALDTQQLPILRGITLTEDDLLRRHVITEIMCNLTLDLTQISAQFNLNAKEHFAQEWQR